MAITLQDVATEAGVAKSAASVVLRNHSLANRYSDETRKRIFDAAEKLGYKRNFFASQILSENKKVIMLCLSYFQDASAAAIAEAFEGEIHKQGYHLLVTVLQDKQDAEAMNMNIMGSHGIQDLAVIGSRSSKLTDEMLLKLLDANVNVVLVNRDIESTKPNKVLIDNYSGGRALAEHVYGLGARKVWTLTGSDNIYCAKSWGRVKSAYDYANEKGYEEPKAIPVKVATTPEAWSKSAYNAVKYQLKETGCPDAILANGDYLAFGAMAALDEAGYKVGKNVIVTGFDDVGVAKFVIPSLTTVKQPFSEMGKIAADLLIDTITGKIKTGRKVIMQPELIVRKSTGNFSR
ncbi:MAG: LacI family DNA-binding transcriptional regulator [Dehalococcoidia bacterium]|nr:LacI family DNA-binding transcriptional regulator [Dehalococcoidia bacterium]